MKSYLLMLILIALFAACGKEEGNKDLCEGVNCQIGAECIDGICVVIDSCAGVTCPIGEECVKGICVVDVDIFVGDYHWVGDSNYYHNGYPTITVLINDTASITRIDDFTLFCRGDNFEYEDTIEVNMSSLSILVFTHERYLVSKSHLMIRHTTIIFLGLVREAAGQNPSQA